MKTTQDDYLKAGISRIYMVSCKNVSLIMSVQSVFFTSWQGFVSSIECELYRTGIVYGKWKVNTFPEFRKNHKTEFHNSVENEQLELRYLLNQSQHPLSMCFT